MGGFEATDELLSLWSAGPWILRAWLRVLRLCLRNPAAWRNIKEQFGSDPRGMYGYLGYALLVGRKGESEAT